jgi:YebC/PmpR family DNA-binding regulatory protein
MAGHSKWANIKHRKAAQDKKRGKIWTKCSKAIIVAAKNGGPDPATNLALRYAIDEAKYANMPKDTIQRAIDKGAGSAGGEDYQQNIYEGYGPAGTALIVEALTDNPTRTVNDIRMIFKKGGGNLGNSGSVAFMFETKGRFIIEGRRDGKALSEDEVMETALEAGAEDVQSPEPGEEDPIFTVLCAATDFAQVKEALEASTLTIRDAEIAKIPQQYVSVAGEDAQKVLNLIEALEDNDDVQKVYSNADIPDDVLAAMG